MSNLLNPCNDLVFKLLLARNPALLADLINALRADTQAVEVVEVINPGILPAHVSGKQVTLDILARDAQGHLFNIEMQMQNRRDWHQRSMYYLAKVYVNQLERGGDYAFLQPAIGIHLLGYNMLDDPEQAVWRFEMRDKTQTRVKLGGELELNLLELPKAGKMVQAARAAGLPSQSWSSLLNWIIFFEQDAEIMNDVSYQPVLEAMEKLKELSEDGETWALALSYERAQRDRLADINYAKQEGEERGIAIGEERGMAIGEERGIARSKAETLQRLLARGFSEAEARELAGLNAR